MNYYIYNNWIAKRDHYTLHRWSCGHCHSGLGIHKKVNYGEKGVWIGPFKKIQYAKDYATQKEVNNRFSLCSRCLL